MQGKTHIGAPAVEPDGAAVRRSGALTLVAATAAALVVRGALLWLRGDYLDYDESMYLLLARSLAEGRGFLLNGLPHTALGPLVPVATAALGRTLGVELLVAQRLLAAVAGALLLVPVWYLLRLAAGARIAGIGIALLVAWPALVDVAPKPGPMWFQMYAGTEPLYLFLLFSAVATAEAALRRRGAALAVLSVLSGALFSLAYLTRAEAVVVGGLYAVLRGVEWARERGDLRRAVATLALAAAAFLAVAAPQLAHLRSASGGWTLSGQPAVMGPMAETLQEVFRDDRYLQDYVRVWYRLDADHGYLLNPYWGTPDNLSPDVQRRQFARLAAMEAAVTRSWPRRVANRLTNYAYMLWTLSGYLLAPFVVLGAAVARRRRIPAWAAAAFAASLVTSLYLAVLPRFYLYLVPAFALWAAFGLDGLSRYRAGLRFDPVRLAAGALVVLLIGLVGSRAIRDRALALTVRAQQDRDAARALAGAIPDGAPVMHWQPRLAYWGGWDWRTMPVGSLDAVAHYAARMGVRSLVLTDVGYVQLRGMRQMLVTVDPALGDSLRNLASGPGHPHPPMRLIRGRPFAGYPTARLALAVTEEE